MDALSAGCAHAALRSRISRPGIPAPHLEGVRIAKQQIRSLQFDLKERNQAPEDSAAGEFGFYISSAQKHLFHCRRSFQTRVLVNSVHVLVTNPCTSAARECYYSCPKNLPAHLRLRACRKCKTRSNHVCHFTPPASFTSAQTDIENVLGEVERRKVDGESMHIAEQLRQAEIKEEDCAQASGSSIERVRNSLGDFGARAATYPREHIVDRAVHVPDAFRGKLMGIRSRHLRELRLRTGADSISYSGERKEIQVSGTPTSVAAAIEALQMRITFLQNAAQLQSAIYPHPCKQYFLLAEGFHPGDDVFFVPSASSPCLGGDTACELRSLDGAGEFAATAEPVRLPRESQDSQTCEDESQRILFFDSSSKRALLEDFLSSIKILEAHKSPAPFDQVKVLFVLGTQQFYPLAPYHPPLVGRTMSFQRLQYMKVTDPNKTLRSDFCTVLSQDFVKQAAGHFRQCSTTEVEVIRGRGIDVYLSDHKLSVGVRIRFEIPRDGIWLENRLQLNPSSIKTTNGRPFMLTFLNQAGTLDFRIELSARYELHSENSENIRELWRMARGCMWDPGRPSEVKLPRDSISRFSIRRVKYWEDATLVGRIPWKAPSEASQNGSAAASQSGRGGDCEIHLAVTKSWDKKSICYSITGSSPQLDNSKGPMDLKEDQLNTVIDFCSELCQAIDTGSSPKSSIFNGS